MSAAVLVPMYGFVRKNSGTPNNAPLPKQTSCRFVRLNRNLVLTWVKSLGTGTYAMCDHLQWDSCRSILLCTETIFHIPSHNDMHCVFRPDR